MTKKIFSALVAMAMTAAVAKAQSETIEIMVVEQADGTKTEYVVDSVSRVYFSETEAPEEPEEPKFIEISADSTVATINLDLAYDESEVQSAVNEADSLGVKSYTITGDFSKLGIWFDGSNVANPFQGSSVEEIDMSGVVGCDTLPGYSFYTVNTLKKITLSETTTTIMDAAFYSCSGLETIVANGVTYIGKRGFYNCTALKSIEMNSLEKTAQATAGMGVFQNCTALEEISLPKLTVLGTQAFYNCTSLKEVSLPALEAIGYEAATNIYAFKGCSSITKLSLPSLTSLYNNALADMSSLEEVDLPNVSYLDFANFGNTALTTLKLTTSDTFSFAFSTTGTYEWGCDTTQVDLYLNKTQEEKVSDNVWKTYKASFTFKSITLVE